jgi:predicted DsbA family dithiol-disulfide isomerase
VAVVLNMAVISDVICPWCYIGKRRLEKAIAAFSGGPNPPARSKVRRSALPW